MLPLLLKQESRLSTLFSVLNTHHLSWLKTTCIRRAMHCTSEKKLDLNDDNRNTTVHEYLENQENDPEPELLTMICCNAEGLVPRKKKYKTKMLREISQTYNCILMCITESHLTKNIRDAEVAIKGYHIYRLGSQEGRKMEAWLFMSEKILFLILNL